MSCVKGTSMLVFDSVL